MGEPRVAWTLDVAGYDELIRELDRIDDTLTRRAKREMLAAAANVLAQRARDLAPRGDPSDKPNTPALRDSIGIAIRDYGDRAIAVVGPHYPQAAHAHNVERGHAEVVFGRRTGRRVPPRPFLRPATDETRDAQLAAMTAVMKRTLRDLGGV